MGGPLRRKDADRWTDWWRRRSAVQHDVVFFAVLALAGTVNGGANGTMAHRLNLLLLLLGPAPVLWRRQRPGLALVASAALVTTAAALGLDSSVEITTLAVVLVTAVAAERHVPAVPAFLIAAAAAASATVLDARRLSTPQKPADFVFGTLGIGLAVGLGVLLRRHRAALVELAARNVELEELRVADARRAVIEDRARIARDLHDVVAHHVSAIAVRANAGLHVADRRPDQAVAALDYVAGAASETLAALRRMVGVLRADQDPAPHLVAAADLAPQPDLDQLPALVAQVNAAGGDAELHERGEARPLSADVEVAVYRVVQEGLTNALRHAPRAAVQVELRWERDRLIVTITNGPSAPGSEDIVTDARASIGHGLLGMRERLALCGAEVTAGPHGRGWRVRAVVRVPDLDFPRQLPPERALAAPEAARAAAEPRLRLPR